MTNEITILELREKLLQQFDPETLLELLDISSEDLLERFEDRIEDNYVSLLRAVE